MALGNIEFCRRIRVNKVREGGLHFNHVVLGHHVTSKGINRAQVYSFLVVKLQQLGSVLNNNTWALFALPFNITVLRKYKPDIDEYRYVTRDKTQHTLQQNKL